MRESEDYLGHWEGSTGRWGDNHWKLRRIYVAPGHGELNMRIFPQLLIFALRSFLRPFFQTGAVTFDFTDDQSALVQVMAITWANVDPDLCRYVVSLSQNELIGVIALVLQCIHHNIIVFCNISWIRTEYENKSKYMQFWCTQNYFDMIHSHLDNMMCLSIEWSTYH